MMTMMKMTMMTDILMRTMIIDFEDEDDDDDEDDHGPR